MSGWGEDGKEDNKGGSGREKNLRCAEEGGRCGKTEGKRESRGSGGWDGGGVGWEARVGKSNGRQEDGRGVMR